MRARQDNSGLQPKPHAVGLCSIHQPNRELSAATGRSALDRTNHDTLIEVFLDEGIDAHDGHRSNDDH